MESDSNPQPQPSTPPKAPNNRRLAWIIGAGTTVLVLLLVASGVGLAGLFNKSVSQGSPQSAEPALRVGAQPFVQPCRLLTEEALVSSFDFKGEVLNRTVSEKTAFPPGLVPESQRNLAGPNPAKGVESSCQIQLEITTGNDALVSKTFILKVEQYADTEVAKEQFQSIYGRDQKNESFKTLPALGDNGYLTTYQDGGQIKNYFGYAQTKNLALQLSHNPVGDPTDLTSSFDGILSKLVKTTETSDTISKPKNFSRAVTLGENPFVDVCPMLDFKQVSQEMGGITYDLLGMGAMRRYTTPVNEARSAPYTSCTVDFAYANDGGGTPTSFPHELQITMFLLPDSKTAKDRLAKLKADISENAQYNANLTGIEDVSGLGDGAFKVHNGYEALGRQNEIDEYRIALGSYLIEVSVTQVNAKGQSSPLQSITDDIIKRVLPAIDASITQAKKK